MNTLFIKLGTCVSVALGLTWSPFSFKSWEGPIQIDKEEKAQTFPKVRKVLSVSLGNTVAEGGFSLSNSDNINKLLSGEKVKLDIDEAGIRFGNQTLSKYDILSSPCENDTYYLLKHVGNWRYTSEDGKPNTSLICHRDTKTTAPYANFKSVKLKWSRPKWRSIPLPLIRLWNCFFTKDRSNNLQIICNKGGGGGEEIQGTFSQDDYQYTE